MFLTYYTKRGLFCSATANVDKRASRVMRLAQENEKLDAELRALSERIAKAERLKSGRLEEG